MINKIDINSNFKEIENLPFLNKFNMEKSTFQNFTQNLRDKVSYSLDFIKKHTSYLSFLMSGIIVGAMIFVKNTPYYYGTTASCMNTLTNELAVATDGAVDQTGISKIWEKLEPITRELMSGADVLGVLALIYCGMLLLMGQTSKGKKIFKNSITGFLLIRLAPLLIDIVGIFTKIKLN